MTAVLASLVLTLQWCDPHRLFEHGWARIGNELSRDFEPLQLPVRFTRDVLEEAAGRIQVVLVRSEPSDWGLPENAMGAVMSRSAPKPQLYVFFPSVARVLGYRPEVLRKRWPTPREERDLSRAFARVIAHEVIHAVLPSRLHTEKGLTCWKVDRSTLLASRVEIDEVLAEELRSALLQRLSARPAPSSNGR